MFLFAQAGCLEYVGLANRITEAMLNMNRSGVANHLPIIIMLWGSGFFSAIADKESLLEGHYL